MTLEAWLGSRFIVEHEASQQEIADLHCAVQALLFTVGLDSLTVRQIESMGKKRAVADYTRVGQVSLSMVNEALVFTEGCCQLIEDWIRKARPA